MASLLLGTSSMASLALSLSSSKSFSSISSLSLSSPPSLSLSSTVSTSPAIPLIYCGRGDRKTAKGKRFSHSFGNTQPPSTAQVEEGFEARPRNKNKGRGPPKAPIPSKAPKQDPLAAGESVEIGVGGD